MTEHVRPNGALTPDDLAAVQAAEATARMLGAALYAADVRGSDVLGDVLTLTLHFGAAPHDPLDVVRVRVFLWSMLSEGDAEASATVRDAWGETVLTWDLDGQDQLGPGTVDVLVVRALRALVELAPDMDETDELASRMRDALRPLGDIDAWIERRMSEAA